MNFITPYNRDWPMRFQQIIAHLGPLLPDGCKFHHVGSTSVPGMPAKDIIDLDVEFAAGCFPTVLCALREAGYEHEGDLGIVGREAFKPLPNSQVAALPVHHLYACEAGAYEFLKHLAYRDYLKADPDRAEWLAEQKIAADAASASKAEYIARKSPSYEVITRESLEWAARQQ